MKVKIICMYCMKLIAKEQWPDNPVLMVLKDNVSHGICKWCWIKYRIKRLFKKN